MFYIYLPYTWCYQKQIQLDSMDVELWYLPELGPIGNYFVFS